MKKPVALSILTLSLGLIACGKGNDQAVVANPGAIAVSAPPYTPPAQPGMTLQQWCSYNGGTMSNANLCTYTQYFGGGSGNWTFNVNIGGPYQTGVPIYSGQRVSVSATSNTKVYLNGTYEGSGSVSFLANASGQLYYYITSLSVNAGLQSAQVTSCYSAPAQATVCP